MEKFLKFSRTASAELQHKINMSIIFNYLRENGPNPRSKIARELNISAPAVSRAIEKLINEGYVLEAEKQITKGGKRPTLIRINKDRGLVIGIDLGKEKLKIAVANFANEIIEKHEGFKISNSKDVVDKLEEEIAHIWARYTQKENQALLKIRGICIGIPADVDIGSGRIISAPLYGSWKDLNLKKALESKFSVPVYVDNDVNLSSLGEKHYGEGKNFEDMVFIEISNGIGAGIIIDNHLLRGSHGSAGEIGFTIIGAENLGFRVKNKGFLEKFASVESLKKRALREIEEGKETLLTMMVGGDLEKIEPNLVCEAAAKGDSLAKSIVDEMTSFLAIAIINLILVLDPQIIVLGGNICGLPHVDKLFVEPIKEKVKTSLPFEIPDIKLSLLGEDAGIIGASYMAIESLLLGEFPYKIEKEMLA